MIGYVSGKPLIQKESLIVVAHGVGYEVFVTSQTLLQAQNAEEVQLFVHTHVREDSLMLFGFPTVGEKEMFELLLSVSGVGPRIALAITSYGAGKIVEAVQTANVGLFSSVPRVGKKLAQKIIIELKPKLGSLYELQLGPTNKQQEDVIEALLALGFSEADIHRAIQQLDLSDSADTASMIKSAMKLMARA